MPYNYRYNPYYRNMYKRAAQPPMDPAMMGGAPPMDPAMMGGMPMDPAMMGGAPPMDPAMMGGAPPMDPSMMGAPPIDPAMAGLPPAAPPPGGDPAAAAPAEEAPAEPAKKNPKQQLNDDITDIKNAIYNMQMIEAAIVKFLNIPIPVEALVRPSGGPDITNPVPEMVNLGGDENKEGAPPSPEGELAKEGSLGRMLRTQPGVSALVTAPPRLKNLLGY